MPATTDTPQDLVLPSLDLRALALAWGAFATGLLAAALARDSAGTLVLAVFCAWQLCDVWTAVQSEGPAPEDAGDARSAHR